MKNTMFKCIQNAEFLIKQSKFRIYGAYVYGLLFRLSDPIHYDRSGILICKYNKIEIAKFGYISRNTLERFLKLLIAKNYISHEIIPYKPKPIKVFILNCPKDFFRDYKSKNPNPNPNYVGGTMDIADGSEDDVKTKRKTKGKDELVPDVV